MGKIKEERGGGRTNKKKKNNWGKRFKTLAL